MNVDEVDLLEYFLQDDRTQIIFLHEINQGSTKPVFMSTPMSDPKVDGELHRMLSFPYFNSSVAGLEALGKVMRAGKSRQGPPL